MGYGSSPNRSMSVLAGVYAKTGLASLPVVLLLSIMNVLRPGTLAWIQSASAFRLR